MAATDRAGREFSVAVPASLVSDTPHLREKTAKLGAIARACSIFGVNEIILYLDDGRREQPADFQLCFDLLNYIETPQYLRKRLFKLSPSFRFTGILPPLQIPSHNVPHSISKAKVGDVREGVVIGQHRLNSVVECGLERTIECAGQFSIGKRVTVRLASLGRNLRGEIVAPSKNGTPPRDMGVYWGYRVNRAGSLGEVLMRQRWDLKVGTSRYGVPVQEVLPSLSKFLKTAQSVIIAFGSPKAGLREILAAERLDSKGVFDFFVNTVPDQQTTTIRTEEAIFTSLSILNLAERLVG